MLRRVQYCKQPSFLTSPPSPSNLYPVVHHQPGWRFASNTCVPLFRCHAGEKTLNRQSTPHVHFLPIMEGKPLTDTHATLARRVALPIGASRDNVKLVVSPDNNGLRVTFSAEGHRTMSKAVRLPFDALFEDISATFTPELTSERGRGGRAANSRVAKRGGVSGLEITVGRVPPQLPKSIEIK